MVAKLYLLTCCREITALNKEEIRLSREIFLHVFNMRLVVSISPHKNKKHRRPWGSIWHKNVTFLVSQPWWENAFSAQLNFLESAPDSRKLKMHILGANRFSEKMSECSFSCMTWIYHFVCFCLKIVATILSGEYFFLLTKMFDVVFAQVRCGPSKR